MYCVQNLVGISCPLSANPQNYARKSIEGIINTWQITSSEATRACQFRGRALKNIDDKNHRFPSTRHN